MIATLSVDDLSLQDQRLSLRRGSLTVLCLKAAF